MKNIMRFLITSALLLSGASVSFAANPDPLTFYCDNYITPFTEGGLYTPLEGGSCIYTFTPSASSTMVLSLFRGIPGSSQAIKRVGVPSAGPTTVTVIQNFYGALGPLSEGDDFFAVAYGIDDSGQFSLADNYFMFGSGSGQEPPTYSILHWKWGLPASPLTITADDKTAVYGAAIPLLTSTLSGFVNGDTPESSDVTGSPECSTSASASSPAGSYPIVCTVGTLVSAQDYIFETFVDGTLTITKAPLTVAADNKAMIAGEALPVLTATISGFMNGETLATSGVTGSASCATTATSASPAGAYPITCAVGTLTAANYSFETFNAGTITVTEAPPPPVLDTQPPVITITNPLKWGVYKRTDTVIPSATVTDASPVTITYWLNGKIINSGVALPLSNAPLISKLSVSATDSAGNAATSTLPFIVVRSTNSCLLEIIAVLSAIITDHTLPDKPTLQNLIENCRCLKIGLHRWDQDDH